MKRVLGAALAVLLAVSAPALSAPRDLPQGPQIAAENQTKGGAQAKKVADTSQGSASKAASAVPIVLAPVQALPAKPKADHGSEDGSEFWPPLFGYRFKVTDSLLVLFTFLLWIATSALVNDARDTAVRQLRAYVSSTATYIHSLNVSERVEIRCQLNNHGQTPAHDLSSAIFVKLWPFPLPANWQFPDCTPRNTSKSVLFKDAPAFISGFSDAAFSHEEIRKIVAGEGVRLYVFGMNVYRDVFRKAERKTRFCYCVAPTGNLAKLADGKQVVAERDGGIFFSTIEQHNDCT